MSETNEKHTPGQVTVVVTHRMVPHIIGAGQHGGLIARCDSNKSIPENDANARRIAACWNALAEIPTVLIEAVANKGSLPMRTAALMAMAFLVGKRAGEAMSEEELDAFERSSINDGASIGEAFKAAYGVPAQPQPLGDDERAEVLKSASSA
jgi:hypothetical protein